MGGKTFQSEGLVTPRMPHNIYYGVLEQVCAKLKPFYSQIESPIEAPEKNDHGDIDLFAISATDIPPSAEDLMVALQATNFKRNKPTLHLAIPWPASDQFPGEPDSLEASIKEVEEADEPGSSQDATKQPLHIQIDLHVCKDIDDLNYTLFMHNHGDFLNIVGGIIRRFGLTCSDSGFYIRIAELESFNKNLARYKILEHPKAILEYLGMDEKRFWQPFASWEECMDYAATCRFHDPAKGKKYDDIKSEMMNAEDRRRLTKRSMFSYWIENYLPSHRGDTAGPSIQMSREEVIEEAKLMFGEGFAKSFDLQRANGIREMQEQGLWADIRKGIMAEGSRLTFAMKGLKREIKVVPDDEALMSDIQRDYAAGRFDVIKSWSLVNWEEVGLRQEIFDRDKCAQRFVTKLENEGKLRPRCDNEHELPMASSVTSGIDNGTA